MFRLFAYPVARVLGLVLGLLHVAAAPLLATQPSPEEAARRAEQRCDRLIEFYDRYGAGRSNHSDGKRNHTRLGAEIDCDDGDIEEGIEAMEKLLRDKRFEVPPTLSTSGA